METPVSGCPSCIKLTAALLKAQEDLAFCGISYSEAGEMVMQMKKYHAAHRCESHRENPWQGINTELDCFVCLKQRLAQATARIAELEASASPDKP